MDPHQESPTRHQQEAFWRQRLSGELPVLALPLDHPHPVVSSFLRDKVTTCLDAETYQTLRDFCARNQLSVFVTLLAVLKVLLVRYTEQTDIIVGGLFRGPPQSQTSTAGDNEATAPTLVLRTDLSADLSVTDILNRVAETVAEAVANGPYSFLRLWREIAGSRQDESLPFRVMFDAEDLSGESFMGRRTDAQSQVFRECGARCDLALNIIAGEQCVVEVEYDAALFLPDTIRRLISHFRTLLEGLLREPSAAVAQLPLLTRNERNRLLIEWNSTTKVYPVNQCIHELVESQVKRTPGHVAVVFDGTELTYQELNQKANRLARRLRDRNVGRGHFVPVLMERGFMLVIAYLAIMKTGAAFSPIDPNWPAARIAGVLAQLGSKVVLLGDAAQRLSDLVECEPIVVDDGGLADASNLRVPASPNDPIYVVFTSGSTGKPKGAINAHRGIVNRLLNMTDRYRCEEQDAILMTSNHVFDASVWQIFWPLIHGARTVIAPPADAFDPAIILGLINQERVTLTDFVPSAFHSLVEYLVNRPQAHHYLRSLRQLQIGGETMHAAPVTGFKSMAPGVGITNAYGPTEASISVVFFEIPEICPDPVPIGRPLNNVYILILDSNLHLVPIGISGELYVGGVCVGLGYLNDQEATDSAFVANPFTEIPCTKLYKTGDKARYLPDGNIQFLGRADHQVKIRGFRVELGEIEAALRQQASVRDTCVVCHEDIDGNKRLLAYVVFAADAKPDTDTLRVALKAQLPEYMVPGNFVILESLPLTSTGKVDRPALAAPDPTPHVKNENYVAPETSVEILLAGLWQELLNVDRVGRHDDFFALGGHSLLGTRLLIRLESRYRVELPLRVLFDHPLLADQAAAIEDHLTGQTNYMSAGLLDQAVDTDSST